MVHGIMCCNSAIQAATRLRKRFRIWNTAKWLLLVAIQAAKCGVTPAARATSRAKPVH